MKARDRIRQLEDRELCLSIRLCERNVQIARLTAQLDEQRIQMLTEQLRKTRRVSPKAVFDPMRQEFIEAPKESTS